MTTSKPKRTIVGDCVAQRLTSRPKCIPIRRPRGVKALGIRYERAVGTALTAKYGDGCEIGPWFQFSDINGRGYCQPDFMFYDIKYDSYTVAECKLTNWKQAEEQLKGLYVPIVQAAHKSFVSKPVGLIILRHLSPDIAPERIFPSFREAAYAARMLSVIPIWHYLGRGPV